MTNGEKSKVRENAAVCRRRGKTGTALFKDSWWREIFRSETHTHTHTHTHTDTHTATEDGSQVITTLTLSNCSWKCLPPDWPKRLSNGSRNKPRHMLLDNKQKNTFFFLLPFLSFWATHMILSHLEVVCLFVRCQQEITKKHVFIDLLVFTTVLYSPPFKNNISLSTWKYPHQCGRGGRQQRKQLFKT